MTAYKKSSTEYSGSVPINTINGLFDVIDDPPIRYGFIVICSDSAAFGNLKKNFVIDLVLFRVVVNNTVMVFHFAFVLVNKNA